MFLKFLLVMVFFILFEFVNYLEDDNTKYLYVQARAFADSMGGGGEVFSARQKLVFYYKYNSSLPPPPSL